MLIQPKPETRPIHEIRDPKKFDQVVASRPGQRVQIVIQAAAMHPLHKGQPGLWWDVLTFWEGPIDQYKQHIPSDLVLFAVGTREGAAFVQSAVRAVI
ncbi:MAG TPA: hypothetical protein VLH81_01570 [Desulfobacterales bacterium]|nr:hypothetical protein [Desulfobacterales bacterium]